MKEPTAAEQYLHNRFEWERLLMRVSEGEQVHAAKDAMYGLLSSLWRRMSPADRREVAAECVATYH